ncbi:hypothetical protein M758_2G006600 [Ceratodon purpureus]|nr:hypothetical protein M758_2G006600 [Ceratodon purpureus]
MEPHTSPSWMPGHSVSSHLLLYHYHPTSSASAILKLPHRPATSDPTPPSTSSSSQHRTQTYVYMYIRTNKNPFFYICHAVTRARHGSRLAFPVRRHPSSQNKLYPPRSPTHTPTPELGIRVCTPRAAPPRPPRRGLSLSLIASARVPARCCTKLNQISNC